ncbi:MAG: ferredoxin domain-containing protein, partial [Bacillota bacterium]
SAKTAPKAAGQDYVTTKVLTGEDVASLADAMVEYGKESAKVNFDRDGANVRNSPVVLLVGLKDAKTLGLNCGACGKSRCADLQKVEGPEFAGQICAWRLVDLGIALGSAVKTASMLNADNRIMYRIGVVARRIGLIDADVVAGIPLSATGKSIYFDRK